MPEHAADEVQSALKAWEMARKETDSVKLRYFKTTKGIVPATLFTPDAIRELNATQEKEDKAKVKWQAAKHRVAGAQAQGPTFVID